jgi:hypothetical protein
MKRFPTGDFVHRRLDRPDQAAGLSEQDFATLIYDELVRHLFDEASDFRQTLSKITEIEMASLSRQPVQTLGVARGDHQTCASS